MKRDRRKYNIHGNEWKAGRKSDEVPKWDVKVKRNLVAFNGHG